MNREVGYEAERVVFPIRLPAEAYSNRNGMPLYTGIDPELFRGAAFLS